MKMLNLSNKYPDIIEILYEKGEQLIPADKSKQMGHFWQGKKKPNNVYYRVNLDYFISQQKK